MNEVKLVVFDNLLCTPRDAIVDKLQKDFHSVGNPYLIVEHASGERDAIRWPKPNPEYLRSALYDAREMGVIPDVKVVALPNGETFEID